MILSDIAQNKDRKPIAYRLRTESEETSSHVRHASADLRVGHPLVCVALAVAKTLCIRELVHASPTTSHETGYGSETTYWKFS